MFSLFLPSLAGGGAERAMVNLANGLVELGTDVDLLVGEAVGPYVADVSPRVSIVNFSSGRLAGAFPRLVGYLRRRQPEALLSAVEHANLLALWARQVAGVSTRLVVSVHTTLSSARTGSTGFRDRLIPALVRMNYPKAEAIVAVSKGVADDLTESFGIPKSKIRVIYNPVVTSRLLEKSDDEVNHPWFKPNEPPVVLAVGRLTKAKDFSTLVRAFGLVRNECRTRLMILGEGQERQELEKLVRELDLDKDVSLPGWEENPYKFMRQCGVFVLSSRWEGFSMVLVEALAVGTPVVATDCPSGPAEILRGGTLGALVPVGGAEALAHAILNALQHPHRRPADALADVEQFTVQHAADAYLRVLRG